MAEINLGNDTELNVSLNEQTNLSTTVYDINYIPDYVKAEQERRANETIRIANEETRQENEADRIALYEDLENKRDTDYWKGDKGDTGATPNITATATVDQTTGTPSVVVNRSGTDENPILSFSFSNIKGERGEASPSVEIKCPSQFWSADEPTPITDLETQQQILEVYESVDFNTGKIGKEAKIVWEGSGMSVMTPYSSMTGISTANYNILSMTFSPIDDEMATVMGVLFINCKYTPATDTYEYTYVFAPDYHVAYFDYAGTGNNKGGTVILKSTYCVDTNSNGVLYCFNRTYSQYSNMDNSAFISKGTLENVLSDRIGNIDSVLDAINGEVV